MDEEEDTVDEVVCLVCARGFHEECLFDCNEPGHDDANMENETQSVSDAFSSFVADAGKRKKGSTYEGLKDPQSTGRKRAARLYPLDKDLPCEWQGKKNCGGGKRPVVGCVAGLQVARHHGPVKNVTRNHEGNVHRICSRCHNHWHELNDLIYDEADYALLPHDPMDASDEELVKDEMSWITGEMGRKFKLASTENMNKSREN